MKAFKLTFLLLALLTVAACDDDEDPLVCGQAEWVGTYTGTIDCSSTDAEDVTVTITASGADAIVIQYQTTTVTATYDPLMFDGCNLDISQSDAGLSLSLSVVRAGNELTLTESIGDATNTEVCTITATKN